jgi:tetratricopeptide (TPR) repeat protein
MNRAAVVFTLLALAPAAGAAQTSVQYRSPAGVSYSSEPDTGGVVARAESALAADPRNPQKFIDLGVAESGVRRYREAVQTFTRGLAIAPDNALLFRWRGHRYLTLRDFDHALQDLTHGNARDSTIYGIWYHLGVTHFVRGEYAGAATCFAKARTIAPDDNEYTGSNDWLWMSLMRAGKPEEARARLAEMRAAPNITSAAAYRQRIRLYRGEIGPDEVVGPADTAGIALATLSFGVGNWYMTRGDRANARRWFERAVAAADGWPAFGFIAAEQELRRMR